MQMAESIKDIFNKNSYYPQIRFEVGHNQKYRIEMNNKFLNEQGDVTKNQKLVTTFTRQITDIPHEFLGLTESNVHSVEFSSNDRQEPINWTFAEGLILPHYIFYCHYLDDYNTIRNEVENENGSIRLQMKKFNDIFSKFPKLPSVYLFIMQSYDIAGLDSFTSHICSKPILFENPGKITEIKTLSNTKCDIGMGLYSDNSFFENATVYAIFHGFINYLGKACSVVEYFSDESKVHVKDENKHYDRSREGNSYYSGMIYIDVNTGFIVAGTMLESVIAVQNLGTKKTTPVHIRRRVRMELIDDGGHE